MPSKPTFAALPPMNAARRVSGAQNPLSTLWLEAQLAAVSGQSTVAGAIRHALSRWEVSPTSPDDNRISNVVERSIRPIALARKTHVPATDKAAA
jgi:hypothetical protein